MSANEPSFWQTPLFIFILTVIIGLLGFFGGRFITKRDEKNLKIKTLQLTAGMKYAAGGYVIPELIIGLDNTAKTDVEIKEVKLKFNNQSNLISFEWIPTKKDNRINQLEIKEFKYKCCIRYLEMNPEKTVIIKRHLKEVTNPTEFYNVIYGSINKDKKPFKTQKDFLKVIKHLGVYVDTNIGSYFRTFTRKERKMFFESTLIKEFNQSSGEN